MMKSYEIDFKEIFNTDCKYKFFAPGRVNIVGEHIDYNGGHVLPIAINLGVYALVSERKDNKFYFFSDSSYEEGVVKVCFNNLACSSKYSFANYPRAILSALKEKGYTFNHGLNVYYYTTLPEQNGLSRSAALEVLTATIFNELYNLNMTQLELAVLCRKAVVEQLDYVSGIMDQAAISLGKPNCALFLDTAYLKYEYIPYSLGDYAIVVCQTNFDKPKAYTLYNQRVHECQRALDIIQNNFNVKSLCQIPEQYLGMIENIMPNDKLYKRVLHVYNEEKRVLKAKDALLNHDIETLARCINESHASLRDYFDVSSKELNTIVDLARSCQGCLAARMTGAGFGGCAIALVHKDFLVEFKADMAKMYLEATGQKGAFFEIDACAGPRRIASHTDSIDDSITSLIQYALDEHLIEDEDRIYMINQIIALLNKSDYNDGEAHPEPLYMILEEIDNYAVEHNIIENSPEARDSFDTKLMGLLVKRPSVIVAEFAKLAKKDINQALKYFYHLSRKSNYIRENRVSKNISFKANTEYGDFEILINLSKNSQNQPSQISDTYPKCLICKESEGYHGNANYPARQNHRTIPLTINHDAWVFQYSPYPYFNEHSILISQVHRPLIISKNTFENMVSFVDTIPNYFIGTNADLPIVGGGILNHEHYHTGRFNFPIEGAESLYSKDIDGVKISILKWPISVIRLDSADSTSLVNIATKILKQWRGYDDLESNIISDDGTKHNTITPVLRKKDGNYQLDIILRNNRTTEKYPLGIFHPHEEYLHIKKENIGLFEAMGYAVLPKTLKEEMYLLKDKLVKGDNNFNDSLEKHRNWALSLEAKYKFTRENVNKIIEQETMNIIVSMLDDCAVFKQNEKGIAAFKRFLDKIK